METVAHDHSRLVEALGRNEAPVTALERDLLRRCAVTSSVARTEAPRHTHCFSIATAPSCQKVASAEFQLRAVHFEDKPDVIKFVVHATKNSRILHGLIGIGHCTRQG